MPVLIADAFTASDGTDLAGRTPDTTTGGATWSEAAGNWQISSNKATKVSASERGACVVNCGESTGIILTCVARSSVANASLDRCTGFMVRRADGNNLWMVGINAQADLFVIVERNASTNTTRASASLTIGNTTDYALDVTLSGQTLTAHLDAANEISYGSASLNESTTIHGMMAYTITDTVDNFQIETVGGGTEYEQDVSGTLTTSGALSKSTSKSFAGTLTSAGAIIKSVAKTMAGTLTIAGALIKSTAKLLAGVLDFAGDLAADFQSGAGTFFQSVGGTLSFGGTVSRQTAKGLAGTLTSAGSLIKSTAKNVAGTLTSSGALSTLRTAVISLAGTLTSSGALIKSTSKNVDGALMPAGAISKAIAKSFSGAITFLGTLLASLVGADIYLLDVEVSHAAAHSIALTQTLVTTIATGNSALYAIELSNTTRS